MLKCIRQCLNNLKTQSPVLFLNQKDVMVQQTRNTYILKRRYEVPLMKKNQKTPRFKNRHFLYEMVENRNVRKHPVIDLILLETVDGYGMKGEQIKEKSLRAYHRLLLPKLAVYATPENIEKYLITDELERMKYNTVGSKLVKRTVQTLSEHCLKVTMSQRNDWTIEKWHISVCFRIEGFIVPEHAITLPHKAISGPDLAIESKEFYVIVKINNKEEVKVRCKVQHYGFGNIISSYGMSASEAIFSEDQEVLDSLPLPKVKSSNTSSKKRK